MNKDVICSNCNNTFDAYKGVCPYCGTQLPNSVMNQVQTIEEQQQMMERPELVNSEGRALNNVQTVDPVLSKIPSVPPGTIEEINNHFAQEQLLQEQAMIASYKKDNEYDNLKLAFFGLFGSAVLDMLLCLFLTSANVVAQLIIDVLVCAGAIAGVLFCTKKDKKVLIVFIVAAIPALLSFRLPLIGIIVVAFFAYKVYTKKA